MKLKAFLLVTLFAVLALNSELYAQCTSCIQDTTNCSGPTGAVCPDVLPDADNGFSYDHDITFNMVSGLTIPGVGVSLDITKVVPRIEGLPSGLSYTFSATQYDPNDNDPASQYGCVKICGIPCAGEGVYQVRLILAYTASAVGFPINLDVPFNLDLKVNAPYDDLKILSTGNYICPGKTVDLLANDTHASYLWSDNATTIGTSVSAAGVYTLEVRDTINGNECVLTDTLEILDFAPDAGSAISMCPGEIVQLHATGADSFSWSPGLGLSDSTSASPVILNLDSTTTFTLTGYNDSCTLNTQVTVTVDQNCPKVCQDCVVDQNCNGQVGAVCPSVLPTGTANEPYQTTFSFNFPYEFDISALPIPIPLPGFDNITVEYVRIDDLNNLPDGLTWETDQKAAANTYYPGLVEGVTGRGCISICGDIECVEAGEYEIEIVAWMGINGIPASLQGLLNFLPQFNNGELQVPITVTMEVVYTNQLRVTPSGTVDLPFGGSVTLVANSTGLTGHVWSTGETGTEITVDESGYYTVTANDGDCDQTVGVTVNIDPVNSIDAIGIEQFKIFPNPTQSEVVLSWESNTDVEYLRIYDMQGKLLMEEQIGTNVQHKNLSLASLSSGLYFVELKAANTRIQKKIIKQ